MEIEQPDSHVDAELLAERQLECAYAEADTNGAAIDWRYWVEQLPMLSAGQAARLMKGLDPVAFSDLSARPTKADPTELCKHALMLEQLAIAQGKTTDTQHGWLAWAAQHKFKVHPAFRDEVNAKPLTAPAQTAATPAPVVAVVPTSDNPLKSAAPVDRGWVMKRGALIKKHVKQWQSIERDFRDASDNGLSKAAKAPVHGEWYEAAALDWAEQRGKLTKEKQQSPTNSIFNLTGTKHTIEG